MSRMGRRGAAIAAVAAIAAIATACGAGISEADETACKLFVSVQNDINEAVNLWKADGSPSGGSDLGRLRGAERAGRVAEAADRATGDLAVEMSEAARLVALADSTGSEDAGIAYYMQAETVTEMCQDLGADVEIVEIDD